MKYREELLTTPVGKAIMELKQTTMATERRKSSKKWKQISEQANDSSCTFKLFLRSLAVFFKTNGDN